MMELFNQTVERIINEANQSANHSITNQARDIKEPTTIEAFKTNILEDYLALLANCVSCKNVKLRQLGINGYEIIIRDNSLWRPDICENHFFNQIVSSIGSKIVICNEITQIELLKCLLEVTCSRISHLRFTDLEKVSDICCSAITSSPPSSLSLSGSTASSSKTTAPCNSSSTSISLTASLSALSSPSSPLDILNGSLGSSVSPKIMASKATAIQSYRYFVSYLITESSIELKDAINHQIIPLLDSLTTKIIDLRKSFCSHAKGDKCSRNQVIIISFQITFNLKCITAILSSLEIDKSIERDLSEFVWQKLGPMLIKLLNFNINRVKSPRAKNLSKGRKSSKDIIYGRGSECLSFNDRNMMQLKEVYGVARELVRLFGPIKHMRPVLESIFHRMLLYPLIHFRLEALQVVKELFKDNQCLIKLCTTVISPSQLSCSDKDLNLMKIIIDSLLECSSTNDQEIAFQSVYCIISLIETLDSIASGKDLTHQGYSSVLVSEETVDDGPSSGGQKKAKYSADDDENICSEETEDDDLSQASSNVFAQPSTVVQDNVIIADELEIVAYKTKLKEIIDQESDQNSDNNPVSIEDDYEADADETASDEIFATDEGASFKQSVSSFGSQCTLDEPSYDKDDNETTTIPAERDDEDIDDDVYVDGRQSDVGSENGEIAAYRCRLISEVREENERQQIILDSHDSLSNQERENARYLIKKLRQTLPELLTMKNSVQIDNALQQFSSSFCKAIWEQRKTIIATTNVPLIINGDGVYLAVYSALSLNLKLIKDNYYSLSKQIKPLITEQQFIDDIYNSGVLVYLSSTWLAELYQQVLVHNLLGDAGYTYSSVSNIALINIIRDIDGGDREVPHSFELSDYRKLTQTGLHLASSVINCQYVGQTIARRILDTFWDSIIAIMESVFSSDANSRSTLSPFLLLLNHDSEKDSIEKRTILIDCLASLQIASKLCILLDLQSRCNGIFHLLTRSIIVNPVTSPQSKINYGSKVDKKAKEMKGTGNRLLSRQNQISLHVSQVLSLRSMLTTGIQIATHCEPCWGYIFQSCAFISELENNFYASRAKKPLKSRLTSFLRSRKQSNDPTPELSFGQLEIQSTLLGMENESDVNKCLDKCIESAMNDKSGRKLDGILVDTLLERSLECLSHLSDRLFSEATSRLNLKSLLAFFDALVANSSRQINEISKKSQVKSTFTLLFTRFCDVLLRIGKSGRPLLHFMRCWGLAVPHLIEASNCSKFDLIICKAAVSAVNDIISTILAIHTELDHFHFNEALFIPYEKILRLELCDSDIQEMIVSSICGFVEGSREDIKSGWRSLFAALRGVVLPDIAPNTSLSTASSNQKSESLSSVEPAERQIERVRQLRVILDIFEAFLNTQNLEIFANAALDCIICLLRLMRDPFSEESTQPHTPYDNDFPPILSESHFEMECKSSTGDGDVDLCLLSLKYLHQLESMLRSMYKMPGCPFFISPRRITLCEDLKTVEIPEAWLAKSSSFDLNVCFKLSSFDKPTRILSVWFTLIDGIFNCIKKCPKIRQAKTIETCMTILGTLRANPGNQFAIYCINHAALPFLQKWTHEINNQLSSTINSPLTSLTNFKHLFGLITHLVVQHVKLWSEDKSLVGVDLMISQTVIILIEATQSSYKEAISNLSLSCFSHFIMETYRYYDETKWSIISNAFHLMHSTCSTSLTRLINAFPNRSLDFYQDLERIRVVARRVQTVPKADLITKGLTQQVFLLDFQRPKEIDDGLEENFSETEKHFIFEIITDEDGEFEIPFRDLIREIYKHSTLVKLIGSIVLTDKPFTVSPVSYFIETKDSDGSKPLAIDPLSTVSSSFVSQSLDLLMASYRDFHEFDTRLGLKLVIQKMARLHVPANLYKQAAFCFATAFLICFNNVLDSADESDEKKKSDLTFGNSLRKIFEKICSHYTDFVFQSHQETGRVDQLMNNPIFLFPESFICESSCDQDKTEVKSESNSNENGKEIEPTDNKRETESQVEVDTANEIKSYIVMSKHRIDTVMRDYRKWKSKHSPLPPSFNDSWNQKNQLPKRYRGNLDATTAVTNGGSRDEIVGGLEKEEDYIIKDSEAYETLHSQILISIFQCLLSLSDYRFNLIMPYLNDGIESLIIYSQSKDLRSLLALIYRRYAQPR